MRRMKSSRSNSAHRILKTSFPWLEIVNRIAKLTLTKVEVANIDAPPAHASPAKYLEPFRDFPTTRCRDLSITFASGSTPAFVKLTDRCV